jgi:hypothetical protein
MARPTPNTRLATKLRFAASALQKVALNPQPSDGSDKLFEKIEAYLNTVDDSIMDTYAWRMFRDIKNSRKVNKIPQLIEHIAKRGLNPQDNAVPVFRDLRKLQLMLENDPTVVDTAPSDRRRIAAAKELKEFLTRLAAGERAPLRDVVSKLNSLDFRKEAKLVQTFIRDAQAISDTLDRVVIQG